MHVPDGFLGPLLAGAFWAVSAVAVGVATTRVRGRLDDSQVALFGVIAAGIFVAQMLNWPIPGGVSAHFVGGALAGIVLGPSLGVLTMTAVVVIQALVFGDGGVLALGLNVFSMAVVDVLVGAAVFRVLRGVHTGLAAFAAGWLGITAGALAVGVALGVSGAFAFELSATAAIMGGGHAVLGLIEGAITALVFVRIATARPEFLGNDGRLSGVTPS